VILTVIELLRLPCGPPQQFSVYVAVFTGAFTTIEPVTGFEPYQLSMTPLSNPQHPVEPVEVAFQLKVMGVPAGTEIELLVALIEAVCAVKVFTGRGTTIG